MSRPSCSTRISTASCRTERRPAVRLHRLPAPEGVQTTDRNAPNYRPPTGITNGVMFQPTMRRAESCTASSWRRPCRSRLHPRARRLRPDRRRLLHQVQISIYADAPPGDIPGYSKWVANGTAYFEKWGFIARASVRYRSTFRGEVSGFAANRVRRRAAAETIVDAQIGYDFQPKAARSGPVDLPPGPEPDRRAVRHQAIPKHAAGDRLSALRPPLHARRHVQVLSRCSAASAPRR